MAARASSRSSGRSGLRGSTEPRVWTPPLRKLTRSTTRGFEVIDFARQVLGLELYPWQEWLVKHALELRPDGTFRFRKVFVLVGRQNGKSTLLQILTLWRMYLDGARLTLGTAQDRGIARDQWLGAVEMAQGTQELADEIAAGSPVTQRGFEHFALVGEQTYRIAASSRRAGRGLSVDLLLMDELREHQTWDAWAAVSKTTNARPNGQTWAVSNAGDASSIVLRHFRQRAHEALGDPDGIVVGESEDEEPDDTLGIFEWSALPGCDVRDRAGWAQSNPSLGYGALTERTLASDAANDPEWVFRTEVMCQWNSGTAEGPFPAGTWESTLEEASSIADAESYVIGVDVSHDRSTTYVAAAGWDQDGEPHAEIFTYRAGTQWVLEWLTERRNVIGQVAAQGKGAPVSELLDGMETAGLPVRRWQGDDLPAGCGQFYDLVRDGKLRRPAQPVLDVAAATAVTKPLGGRFVWDRAKSPTDIAPLLAANAAVWALLNQPVRQVSAYESHGLLTV